MQFLNWFPHSTRNRIAMLMGLFSLLLFITWNLMPYPDIPWGVAKAESRITAIVFWPKMASMAFIVTKGFRVDLALILYLVYCIDLFFLAILVGAILPSWRILQGSALLRIFPATLMLIGFVLSAYYLIISTNSLYQTLAFCISLNFLSTAIALLLFKNESSESEDHGRSSA